MMRVDFRQTFNMISTQYSHYDNAYRHFLSTTYFPNLDWLRALAIVGVILHHVALLNGPTEVLQANGRYGVSLFFAVSGFLICSLLIREEQQHGCINLRDFYIRRSLRLFPLYYSILLLYVALIYFFDQFSEANQALFWEKLPFHISYLSNLTAKSTQGPFFFSWSLAVEEQFYLVIRRQPPWPVGGNYVGRFSAMCS
jgi:peptidoglycan/LPS O-acetylase OafA/YrhL